GAGSGVVPPESMMAEAPAAPIACRRRCSRAASSAARDAKRRVVSVVMNGSSDPTGGGDHWLRWGARGALRKRVADGELRKSAEIPIRRPQLRNTMMQAQSRDPGVVDPRHPYQR